MNKMLDQSKLELVKRHYGSISCGVSSLGMNKIDFSLKVNRLYYDIHQKISMNNLVEKPFFLNVYFQHKTEPIIFSKDFKGRQAYKDTKIQQNCQVMDSSPAAAKNLFFIIIQRIFKFWYSSKLTNGDSPPFKFCRQKYSRLRWLLHVKGQVICFYLGWSGSILQFRQNMLKLGSKSCSSK